MYKYFSNLYDNFMEVDYEQWSNFIIDIIKKHYPSANLVLELGCGTGNITTKLTSYEIIALDSSTEMLMIAQEKAKKLAQDNILFINQDMRYFELYGTVDVCLCICDCLNYITKDEEILNIFKLVKNYLNPGGLFIFDINTHYKFKEILASNSFSYTEADSAIIWENFYDDISKINEYYLTIFNKNENGSYNRYEETHFQKSYSIDTINKLLSEAGLVISKIYDNYTDQTQTENTQRMVYVVKKLD